MQSDAMPIQVQPDHHKVVLSPPVSVSDKQPGGISALNSPESSVLGVHGSTVTGGDGGEGPAVPPGAGDDTDHSTDHVAPVYTPPVPLAGGTPAATAAAVMPAASVEILDMSEYTLADDAFLESEGWRLYLSTDDSESNSTKSGDLRGLEGAAISTFFWDYLTVFSAFSAYVSITPRTAVCPA